MIVSAFCSCPFPSPYQKLAIKAERFLHNFLDILKHDIVHVGIAIVIALSMSYT